MVDRLKLEEIFIRNDCTDFKWISPVDIEVAHWVRMKCRFGCRGYGRSACCPPHTPSVEDCLRFFREYKDAVVFHFSKFFENPEDRRVDGQETGRRLFNVERETFLAGCRKAFMLTMQPCRYCADCPADPVLCKNPQMARPSPEAMAMDVYATVRKYGYPIEVLRDYTETANRYAFLMVD